MRLDAEVSKRGIGVPNRALRDAPSHQRLGGVGAPVLRFGDGRRSTGNAHTQGGTAEHGRAISAGLWIAATASAALLTGCSDLGPPDATQLPGAELLPVGIAAEAPGLANAIFWVTNARTTTYRVVHPDGFNSPYVELEFPAGALESLNGTDLGPSDSVQVTVFPDPDGYGLTLRPAGLALVPTNLPTARFVLAAYGDLSVADGSSTYASRTAYANALAIWQEVGVDLWERVPGSRFLSGDVVSGRLPGPGRFMVAAPR